MSAVMERDAIDPADLKLVDGLDDDEQFAAELWAELADDDKVAAEEAKGTRETVSWDYGQGTAEDESPLDTKPPARTGDTATQEAAGTDPGPDVWQSAPPELRASYDSLKAERDRLEHQTKSEAGRQRALQRRIEELSRAAQPRDDAKAPSATEVLKTLRNDYPDIAQPLAQALELMEGRLNKFEQIEDGRRQAAASDLVELVDAETARLAADHPDWLDTLSQNGEAFAAWVEDQPRRIREAAYRNGNGIVNADEAAEVVSLFKQHIGIEADVSPAPQPAPRQAATPPSPSPSSLKRERQLAGMSAPQRQSGRPTISGIPEDGDPEVLWNQMRDAERTGSRF